MSELKIVIPAFSENEWIPNEYSARYDDISPEIKIYNIDKNAKSIAITLDDSSHPLFPNYNHWIIWNLPIIETIPKGIAKGETLPQLNNACQGIAYGKHCYKGPKPPFKTIHNYTFTVYILDCKLDLPTTSTREDFLEDAKNHILQNAQYVGKFQSHRKK